MKMKMMVRRSSINLTSFHFLDAGGSIMVQGAIFISISPVAHCRRPASVSEGGRSGGKEKYLAGRKDLCERSGGKWKILAGRDLRLAKILAGSDTTTRARALDAMTRRTRTCSFPIALCLPLLIPLSLSIAIPFLHNILHQ
jgi:hypothetical protein